MTLAAELEQRLRIRVLPGKIEVLGHYWNSAFGLHFGPSAVLKWEMHGLLAFPECPHKDA